MPDGNLYPAQSQTAAVLNSVPAAGHVFEVFECNDLWRHETPLLEWLEEHYGDRELGSLGGSYGWPVRYRQEEDYEKLPIRTLGDYIRAFRQGEYALPYLRHLSLNRALPETRMYIVEPPQFRPNWVTHPKLDRLGGPELFLGQAGTVFGNLHQDQAGVHIGFVQLQGEKEIVLFPPEDGRYLYRMEGIQFPYEPRNSRVNYEHLRDFDTFPLLEQAHETRLVLRAGQAVVLPSDWWHTTRNLSDSVSYNIRIINRTNVARAAWRHVLGIPRGLRRFIRRRV